MGGDFLVASFARTICPARVTTKGVVNFSQYLTSQTCSHRCHILLGSFYRKFNNIRRLNTCGQRFGRAFRRFQ
jgi:hypothetical protein